MINETGAVIQKRLLDILKANPAIYDPTNIDPDKRGLTSPSQVSLFRSFLNVVSTEIGALEAVMAIFEQDIETLIRKAPAGSPNWLQQKVFEFQYSATDPQIIQLINYAPEYAIINTALRIVTQCAVVNDPAGGYTVKVASDLAPLSTGQADALQSYLRHINFGVPFRLVNSDPDYLMIGADVYYDGQYASVILNTVTDAINKYISDFDLNDFNGEVVISKLEDVIQSVPGVTDVVLKQVEARANSIPAASALKMVDNSAVRFRRYSTHAGYVIIDTDSGRTLADTLTFILA